MVANRVRYSDADLMEFKKRIEKKLEYARDDYEFVSKQITDQTENMDSEGDWMDSSSSNNDLELLYIMANRQRKHIEDLEKALIRIENKTYGICQLTGEIIDKRRLLAVPSTTKSLAAKLSELPTTKKQEDSDDNELEKAQQKKEFKPKIISRIVRKPSPAPAATKEDFFEDSDEQDDDLDFGFDDSDENIDTLDIIDPSSLEEDED